MTRSEMEILIKARAAITISIFAALLAINTMVGNSNSSKVLTNTIAANNQWAWYQAKNVRAAIYENAGKPAAAERMQADMNDISNRAKEHEAERDHAKARAPYFTYAGSALQIAIVLSTASILAVAFAMFWWSVAVGSVGAALLGFGFFFA